jgi:hypothetical protein
MSKLRSCDVSIYRKRGSDYRVLAETNRVAGRDADIKRNVVRSQDIILN